MVSHTVVSAQVLGASEIEIRRPRQRSILSGSLSVL